MSESERPEYLYHYTTFRGLEGILKENCLWATDGSTSNDSTELIYGVELLKNYLKKETEFEKILLMKVDDFIQFLLGKTGITRGIFLSCFSKANEDKDSYSARNGLLSQWRGYGLEQGYAIKFQSKILLESYSKQAAERDDIFFGSGDVAYVDEELFKGNKDLLESIKKIKTAIHALDKDPTNFNGSNQEKILFQQVLLVALFSKHLGFEEEKEFRVAHILWDNAPSEKIFFYEKNGILRSYIKLFSNLPRKAISEIIIGPSPHKEKNKRKIEIILEQMALKAEVKVSETPYV